jgi:hypothetical protein
MPLVTSTSPCRVLQTLCLKIFKRYFFIMFLLILTILDNADVWKSVALMTTADGDSPDKIQGRSHQSPVCLTSLV